MRLLYIRFCVRARNADDRVSLVDWEHVEDAAKQ